MKTFIINYKAYKEGVDNGIEIALAARETSERLKLDVVVAVPFTLCRGAAKLTRAIAQKIDPIEPGASTGHVSWYEIARSGCKGSLINHAENRMAMGDVRKAVGICKNNGLESYVCVASLDEAREVARMNPTAVAYEPPELIGAAVKGLDVSVTTADERIVREFVELVHGLSDSLALIGAGIKDANDVRKGVELGSDGVMVSSIIMKGDSRSKMEELAAALVGRDLP